ncbi:glycoside hydrolase family 32 protein [Jeotgalibacillus soli]|uniref:glycoside hydrolase family 32 protein n=1 Tax=Jeotgalibacillus soli TaxID=889306 RepID=UPI0005973BB2|nr:sucrose-6-phosphate hydrolase [Jeotgalibacillus soli]
MTKDQELRNLAYAEIQQHQKLVEADPYRLLYHLMPPVGLLNDPNGVIQWQGIYHVFYQWMPFDTDHGAKFWGHYTSTDLVNWKHEEIGLTPSEWFEKNGCYSGSAIDHEGELRLYYTGNVKDEQGERQSYQCLATSYDGSVFHKKGVVLELPDGYTAHFRDPKVWKEGSDWYMVVGAQSTDEKGMVALFHSKDGLEWSHLGAIAGSGIGSLGEFGYMWECPDLFTLNEQDLLIVSPQGLEADGLHYQNVYQAGYFIGKLDCQKAAFEHGNFTELDRGFDFYAPQTTSDDKGRRLLIGWMSVPDQNEQEHPTIKHKWIHNLTLPRELTLVNGKLFQAPAEELKELRKNQAVDAEVALSNEKIVWPGLNGKTMELELTDIDLANAQLVEIGVRDHARIIYEPAKKLFTLARKSYVDGNWEKRQCKLSSLLSLTVYLDHSSIEIFINGGEEVFSARIFPDPENETIFILADGTLKGNLKKWDL